MEFRIEKRPATPVACMRETGPFMESANKAWQRLAGWMESVDVVNEATEFLGVMHDNPEATPAEELRYDACLSVPAQYDGGAEVLQYELSESEYAVGLHTGPYERLGQAWGEMMAWLGESGRQPDFGKPCFEIYRNDPRVTSPEALQTEIFLALQPRG